MATAAVKSLGLNLATPANNQQSAQRAGTFTNRQAPSGVLGVSTNTLSNPGYSANNAFQTPTSKAFNPIQQASPTISGSAAGINTGAAAIPGGGGGGAPTSSSPTPYYDSSTGQTFGSMDDYNSVINQTYDSSNNYLNQAEQQVNADYPTVQQDIQGAYDSGVGGLTNTHDATAKTLGQQGDQAGFNHENALAMARRLYSELHQGYQQRFGGATSAGDAASELANVEQQRQTGQNNRSYQDTISTINNKKLEIDNQFQQGIKDLATQKTTSLNQAQRDFQNKLLQISQSRAANEQAKGQARLSALQELRNQVFQINQQNTQFQQTLEAQKQQAALQLQNYQALAGQGQASTAQALASYNLQYGQTPTSSYGAAGQGSTAGAAPLTGSVTAKAPKWDPTTNSWK